MPQNTPPAHAPGAQDVEAALRAALDPHALVVTDDSHLHAGHAGAREGRHFSVHLVSQRFEGLGRVARHRLVYDALASWLPHGIHALALTTLTPGEAAKSSR
jgi:BolA protein